MWNFFQPIDSIELRKQQKQQKQKSRKFLKVEATLLLITPRTHEQLRSFMESLKHLQRLIADLFKFKMPFRPSMKSCYLQQFMWGKRKTTLLLKLLISLPIFGAFFFTTHQSNHGKSAKSAAAGWKRDRVASGAKSLGFNRVCFECSQPHRNEIQH